MENSTMLPTDPHLISNARDSRVDNIHRATRQTRKVRWYDVYKGPWQFRRVVAVKDAVKERHNGEPFEDYKERRKSATFYRRISIQKGFRNFSAKILRERDGRIVNIGPGTFRKCDYE